MANDKEDERGGESQENQKIEINNLMQIIENERGEKLALKQQNDELIKQITSLTVSISRLETQVELLLNEKKGNKRNGSNRVLVGTKRQNVENSTEYYSIFNKKSNIVFTGGNDSSMDMEFDSSNFANNTPLNAVNANDVTTSTNNKNDNMKTGSTQSITTNSTKKSIDSSAENSADDSGTNEWQRVTHKNSKSINKSKIQPIHVKNIEFETLYSLLTKDVGINKFTINQANGNIKIFSITMEIFNKICELLRSNTIEFHTYLHGEEKRSCYLIKGLPSIQIQRIKGELVRYGLSNDIMVHQFISGFQKQNPEIKHKFTVKLILPPNTDINILKSIKTIFGIAVTFEKFNSNGIIQCKKCQNYFHTAARCFQNYRCVKCVDTHDPGCCGKSIDDPPKCVNCGGLHTANDFLHCKYFLEKIKPNIKKLNENILNQSNGEKSSYKSTKKTSSSGNNLNNNTANTIGGISFANVLKNAKSTSPSTSYSTSKSTSKSTPKSTSNSTAHSNRNIGTEIGNNSEIISLMTNLLIKMDLMLSKQK